MAKYIDADEFLRELHARLHQPGVYGFVAGIIADMPDVADTQGEMLKAQADKIFLYEKVLQEKTKEIKDLQFSVQQLSGFLTHAKSKTIAAYIEIVKKKLIAKGLYPVIFKNALKEAREEMEVAKDIC